MIDKKVSLLRKEMEKAGVDAWLITGTDPHQSEYIEDYYKLREFVCGFTGSAGTLVVTESEALLWTDGRYFR